MRLDEQKQDRESPPPCSKCGWPVRIYDTKMARLHGGPRVALQEFRVCSNRRCQTNLAKGSRLLSDMP